MPRNRSNDEDAPSRRPRQPAAKTGRSPSKAKRPAGRSRLDDARERMYHDLILESAEVIFGEKGFDGATMQDIAARAGISLKTLYGSFASKKALVEEVQVMRGEAFVEVCIEAISAGATPMEGIANGIHAYVAYLFEYRDWMKLHLRTRASWSLRPRGKQAVAMWATGLSSYRDAIVRGIEAGDFHPAEPADPDELAGLIQAIMQVSVARAADRGADDAAPVADRIVANVRMLLGARD